MIDLATLTFAQGIAIPFLTGFITKQAASAAVKAWTTAVLSFVAGVVDLLIVDYGTQPNWKLIIFSVIGTLVTSNAAYVGLWRPSGAAPAVQAATKDIGIG